MIKKSILQNIFIALIFVCLTASAAFTQTTAFTYQGKLTDTGTPQTNYQMEFKLFGSAGGADQVGATVSNSSVSVTQGAFTVGLDFGAAAFDGSERFLEIAVKRNAGDPFTVLAPRQKINSAPYAIKSKSSDQLGGVDASEYVTTTSGGNAFIKNSTQQQTADFNVSGNGVVGGNLGIGVTPFAGIKLDVNGDAVIRTSGSGGNIQFGTPSAETGMTIIGANRADVRFDGSTLKLLAGVGRNVPPVTNGININAAGSVGIGTTNPTNKLDVAGNIFTSGSLSVGNGAGITGSLSVSSGATITGSLNVGNGATISNGLNVNSGNLNVSQPGANLNVASGISLGFVPGGGDFALCYKTSTKFIANCSASSLRYKQDVQNFDDGLSVINRLRPISFIWKDDGRRDIGFAAEEVEQIEPLLAFRNQRGEIEEVKYQLIGVVLVKAVKEQQAQIEKQNQQIEAQQNLINKQQTEIESLKRLVCLDHPTAEICRREQK